MKIKSKSLRKKSVAVLAGLAIAGTVGASAASLGGLNSDDLGADTGVVASCDTTGIDVDYTTTFDGTEYVVNNIQLSNVNAACNGQAFDLTALADDGSGDPTVVIDSFAGSVVLDGAVIVPLSDNNTAQIDLTGSEFSAEALTGLALSISG